MHLQLEHFNYCIDHKEGPSRADEKIRNDTFRTFRGDANFWSKVTEIELIRLLNAHARLHFESVCALSGVSTATDDNVGYVQGATRFCFHHNYMSVTFYYNYRNEYSFGSILLHHE